MDIVSILRTLTDECRLNIPQATLAFYCDVSTSAISSYVTGKSKPTERIESKLRDGLMRYFKEIESIKNGLYS